ncbi:MAG: biofilm regulation protein kinase SiaB [Pseudomonadota bacterium]
MASTDLFRLREYFQEQNILLCFNGPISRSLIEEIGNALKNYLEAEETAPDAVMDVFGVYVEMTQNIRHYATRQGYNDTESAATVVVARDEDGHYLVESGNLVEPADGEALLRRVEELAGMDSAELKAAFKSQLRTPREMAAATGAGLGLIDIARKSARPLAAQLEEAPGGRSFFSLIATI